MDKRIISVLQKGGGGGGHCSLFVNFLLCVGLHQVNVLFVFFLPCIDKLYCMRGPRAFEGYLVT